jgi:hypothetical protein
VPRPQREETASPLIFRGAGMRHTTLRFTSFVSDPRGPNCIPCGVCRAFDDDGKGVVVKNSGRSWS